VITAARHCQAVSSLPVITVTAGVANKMILKYFDRNIWSSPEDMIQCAYCR
jgi:hypothetical protein